MTEVNKNCLQGMRCPQCRSLEPFQIAISTSAIVFDNGVHETTDNEWSDTSACRCIGCGHEAAIADFYLKRAAA